jgi:Ribbon-helix-helix protein, copG family
MPSNAPELLAKVDERAAQMGMSRAACMSLAILQWLERGL